MSSSYPTHSAFGSHSPHRSGPSGHGPSAQSGFGEGPSCIALLDARFVHWLQGADEEDPTPAAPAGEPPGVLRERLGEVLAASLRGARVHARLTRMFWYTSQAGAASVDGQVMRLVPSESVDGGAGLVLAMARDALQLAEQRACSHLLIASDDDRLLATVDAVQLRGLRVHLLADDSALDLASLQQSDPAWASLLRQADTRLVVRDLQHPPGRGPRREREGGAADELEAIPPLVNAWLAGLSETTRLMLHDQLPTQRGLPQEADRELLQQLSHRLGRPLTVPERKLMRELARRSLADRGLPEDEPEAEDEPQRA
jgi:hypothetical protein